MADQEQTTATATTPAADATTTAPVAESATEPSAPAAAETMDSGNDGKRAREETEDDTPPAKKQAVETAPQVAAAKPVLSDEQLLARIKKQVEFYFGDSNFPRDKFLRKAADDDVEGMGWVPIETLLLFNRLKALSTDPDVVAKALDGSDVCIVSDDKRSIRRTKNLPENDDYDERCVYAKGFDRDMTLDQIEETFKNAGYETLSIRMRRTAFGKKFKGTLFAELKSTDAVKSLLESEKGIEVNGKKLELKTKADFIKEKKEQMLKLQDRRAREKTDAKSAPKSEEATKPEGGADAAKKEGEEAKTKEDGKDSKNERTIVPGLVLKFENAEDGLDGLSLKSVFAEYGQVRFVDVNPGGSGYARFAEPGTAARVAKEMTEGKRALGADKEKVPTFSLVEGEEEQKYWENAWKAMDEAVARSRARRSGGGGGRGRRGGRGGRSSGRGRHRR